LNIAKGDILFVKDPNVYNQKTIGMIKDKVNVIVCVNKPTKKTRDELLFSFVSADDMLIKEFSNFAIVKKERIDKLIDKSNVLNKIIEDYKSSRR
jgi:predicted RNase H-like nuclease (RuvC/YqgF family)